MCREGGLQGHVILNFVTKLNSESVRTNQLRILSYVRRQESYMTTNKCNGHTDRADVKNVKAAAPRAPYSHVRTSILFFCVRTCL